jgi:hypothetical protein
MSNRIFRGKKSPLCFVGYRNFRPIGIYLIFDATVKILWSSLTQNKDLCRFKAFCEAIFFSNTSGKLKPRPLTIPFLAIRRFLPKIDSRNDHFFFEIDGIKITFVFTLFLQFILINIKTIQMLLK